ncbi:unnamed protein product [Moneuplotes crassus]|uniref:Exonuclease 1 n=1 Tax=Euplotes crassus TaxID=5936 RepID=A0AAD1YCN5_EUPCR|nr:unnamed protein product [Moneuplotes crassus]
MGIKDLLKQLDEVKKNQSISVCKGKKIGVDAYCWLHKGTYNCSKEVINGKSYDKVVRYCNKRIDLMISKGVIPVIVFDGGKLLAKKKTEEERQETRNQKLQEAIRYEKTTGLCCSKKYDQAVDVTPRLARLWISSLRSRKIEYYVAPYEADAQLAYLYIRGIVSAVNTEDSDLLCFGVKRAFYKLDKNGRADEYDMTNYTKIKAFADFTDDMFKTACILSGCDYLPSIKGVGLKKAIKYVKKYETFDKIYPQLLEDFTSEVPDNYKDEFKKAYLTFHFQLVYCPEQKKIVNLNQVEGHPLEKWYREFEDSKFWGSFLPLDEAQKIARGDIDPITKETFKESDFPCVDGSSGQGYDKSKLADLWKRRSEFKTDAQFWSNYNKLKKAEGLTKNTNGKSKAKKNDGKKSSADSLNLETTKRSKKARSKALENLRNEQIFQLQNKIHKEDDENTANISFDYTSDSFSNITDSCKSPFALLKTNLLGLNVSDHEMIVDKKFQAMPQPSSLCPPKGLTKAQKPSQATSKTDYFSQMKTGMTLAEMADQEKTIIEIPDSPVQKSLTLATGKLSPSKTSLTDMLKQIHKDREKRKKQRTKIFRDGADS